MKIESIDNTTPNGPLLEIEIVADISKNVKLPITIDITPIDEIGKHSPNRIENLEQKLNELGIIGDEVRKAITEEVEKSQANIVRFCLD